MTEWLDEHLFKNKKLTDEINLDDLAVSSSIRINYTPQQTGCNGNGFLKASTSQLVVC